jgi:membrane protein required for beta-lactamase induction
VNIIESEGNDDDSHNLNRRKIKMEFPIYYVILDTMLLLHSAFGVFLIALWHACILILAYCWGANKIMKEWIAENERMWPDDDEGGE